jgi:hypothetical protein
MTEESATTNIRDLLKSEDSSEVLQGLSLARGAILDASLLLVIVRLAFGYGPHPDVVRSKAVRLLKARIYNENGVEQSSLSENDMGHYAHPTAQSIPVDNKQIAPIRWLFDPDLTREELGMRWTWIAVALIFVSLFASSVVFQFDEANNETYNNFWQFLIDNPNVFALGAIFIVAMFIGMLAMCVQNAICALLYPGIAAMSILGFSTLEEFDGISVAMLIFAVLGAGAFYLVEKWMAKNGRKINWV